MRCGLFDRWQGTFRQAAGRVGTPGSKMASAWRSESFFLHIPALLRRLSQERGGIMKARHVLTSTAILGAILFAAPAFAQGKASDMDVAPGGGAYTRQDVSVEPSDRMSHPVVGEARAPSSVAKGSLSQVDQVEDSMTARLNEQQLQGGNAAMSSTRP
jgi:hypothetical protein